ncbi:MAG: efflux RND transporter periplasmic adaptor subunit [Thermodesulfovibrionales bacterium]
MGKGFFVKKWLWILAILVSIIIAIFIAGNYFNSIKVKTEVVKRRNIEITVTATSTGTIKSDTEAKITAQRTGSITKLYFDEGDIVKAGQVVAELESNEAYYNMKLSEATLNKANFVLDQMKAAYESMKVDVEKNIEKAKAVLIEVDNRRKRLFELKERGYVTEMDIDMVQKEYEIARANLDSAIASRDTLKAKKSEIMAQEEVVREAMNSFNLAKLNYDYSFIKSPISGVITSRPVRIGEGVNKGSVIATVVSTESMYIEAFIDEADVARVRTGESVNITMDSYPKRVFKGEVYRISPVVLGGKQETRTFEIRVRLKDKGIQIKPGMSADIEIIVESIPDVIAIPSQAIIEKNGKKYVYIIKDSKAYLIPVEIGRFNWTLSEILSGLKEGDRVIINPEVEGLKEGVRIKKSEP